MKRYLVVSDSHTNRECLVELVAKYNHVVDQMFHCGDSQLMSDDQIWESFIVVRGNCDFGDGFPKEQIYRNEQDTIFMTHGHLFNVNFSLNNLIYKGEELNATMSFYGHTHQLGAEMVDGQLILNPGSIVEPRGRYRVRTYAIVESDETNIVVYFYNQNHHLQEELTCRFTKTNA